MIDFGFARYLKKGELAYDIVGTTPIYMDLKILNELNKFKDSKKVGYDEKLDIWSLGDLFYEMLIGKSAFEAQSMKELFSKVEKGNYLYLQLYLLRLHHF